MGIGQMIAALIGQAGEEKTAQENKKMLAEQLARLKSMPLPELKAAIAEQPGRPEAANVDPELQDALAALQ